MEACVQRWIEVIIGERIEERHLATALQSGRYLCVLIIKLYKGLGMKQQALAVTISEDDHEKNIKTFLNACVVFGLKPEDCFDYRDLAARQETSINSEMKIIQTIARLREQVVEKAHTRAKNNSRLIDMIKEFEAEPHRDAAISPSSSHSDQTAEARIEYWKQLLDGYQKQLENAAEYQSVASESSTKQSEIEYSLWCTLSTIRTELHTATIAKQWIVPDELHAQLWMLLSGAHMAFVSRPGYYSSLVEIVAADHDDSDARRQIEVDISRTVKPTETAEWTPALTDSLRRVLLAYSFHNPQLGYCQGLNYIVARMLLCVDEERAFWLLVKVVELQPDDYYTNMVGIAVDQKVFSDFVQLAHPQVSAHLQHLGGTGLELTVVCPEWFLTLFSSPFPKQVTFMIWDIIFAIGYEVVFTAALALLEMGKPKLLECTAYGDAMSFLDNIGASISDYSSLLRTSWTHEIVNSPRIEDLRAHHRVVLSAGLSMPIVKPDKKRSGRNRKAITYTASGNPPPISPEELSLSCAYFFNGAPPEIIEDHWTYHDIDMPWEVSSFVKIGEEDDKFARQAFTKQLEEESVELEQGSGSNSNWKQKIGEWQREKRHEKHKKEILKKRIRQKKLAEKIQRHKEKHQLAVAANDGKAQTLSSEATLDKKPSVKSPPVPKPPVHPVHKDPSRSYHYDPYELDEPRIVSSPGIRRNVSDPCLSDASRVRRNSERLLLERANVVSYLHRTANEPSSTCSSPQTLHNHDTGPSGSITEAVSFLGRLSVDLESYIEKISFDRDIDGDDDD